MANTCYDNFFLGSQSANPTITANDRASDVIENVRDTLNMAGAMNVSPEVAIEDSASGVLGAIQDTLEAVNSTTATPEVEVEDQARGKSVLCSSV